MYLALFSASEKHPRISETTSQHSQPLNLRGTKAELKTRLF